MEQYFPKLFLKNLNNYLETCSFLEDLKYAEVVPIYMKITNRIKVTIDLLIFYQTFQKYMKEAGKKILMNTSVISYQNISSVLSKIIGLRTVFCLWQRNREKLEIRKLYLLLPNKFIKSLLLYTSQIKYYCSNRKSLIFIEAYLKSREQKN